MYLAVGQACTGNRIGQPVYTFGIYWNAEIAGLSPGSNYI